MLKAFAFLTVNFTCKKHTRTSGRKMSLREENAKPDRHKMFESVFLKIEALIN